MTGYEPCCLTALDSDTPSTIFYLLSHSITFLNLETRLSPLPLVHNVTFYKGVILTGPHNYAEWELSVNTSLILKDLEISAPMSIGDTPSPEDKDSYKKSRQAFALLIKSLSPEVQASLPADI